MSAIAGCIDVRGDAGPTVELEAMLAHLARRAPGERIATLRDGVSGALGARGGYVVEAPVVVVASARIDNRAELVAALGMPAADPVDPAALIAAAYLRWGAGLVVRLRGDFAFALWDPRRRELVCGRDHLGVRPLYYRHERGVVRIASEPRALFAKAERPEPNDAAIARFIANEYSENGETLYRDAFALPAAHILVANADGVRTERYWWPDPFRRLPPMGDEDYARLLRDEIASAVKARLRGRRSVGGLLSGGTDSSSVACEAGRQSRLGELPTPTLLHFVYPGLPCDESTYARDVARRWALPLVEMDALSRPDLTAPARAASHPDVPYHPGGYILDGLFAMAAGRGIELVATGEGGDLCLTATPYDLTDALVRGELGRVARATRIARTPFSPAAWRDAFDRCLRPMIPLGLRRAVRPLRRLGLPAQEPPLASHWVMRIERERDETEHRWRSRPFPDGATRTICRSIEEQCGQLQLVLLDRMAGAHGLELCHPLLDLNVVELLLAMPPEQRHVPSLDKPKPVLRRAMRDVLPPSIHRRAASAEFSSFLQATLFDRHLDEARALLRDSRLVARGIADRAWVEAIGNTGDLVLLRRMLNLTAMEIWLRQLSP